MDKETYEKKMQAQAREAATDMQAKYQEQIRELRERRDEMETQSRKIHAAGPHPAERAKQWAPRTGTRMVAVRARCGVRPSTRITHPPERRVVRRHHSPVLSRRAAAPPRGTRSPRSR